ncbi:GL14910 [Drosophila persimilis]|uniref:GL14910 n=1 Tax=Drosophila persimilis TaxID=7234 RepID=B4H085_DROPE|nr:GL14910 [Drosophila persimilis]
MTDLNELLGSPFVRVKLVAFVHFFFISNAMLGSWGHGAYEFYNILFIMSMFWAIHCKDSIEAVQSCGPAIPRVLTRGGSLQTGSVFPTSQQRSYQDIDRPTQPTPTNSQPGPNVASIF